MKNEVKVGLLLVAALAVFAWMGMTSGTFGFGRKEAVRAFFTVFDNVEGISDKSPVKMAGVEVGDVTAVELQSNGTAILRYTVKQSVALPANVSAQVATSGLIGERYVALVPGREENAGDAGLLGADVKQLPAAASTDPAKIKSDFARVASDMESVTGMLKQVLGNPENAEKLQGVIDTLSKFSESVGGNNGKALQDLSTAAANLAEVTNNLKSGNSVLGQMVVKDANARDIQLQDTLKQLNAAVKDFREIMAKVNGGQGSLGQLVNSSETSDKLNGALDTVNGVGNMLGVGGGDPSRTSFLPRFRAEGTMEANAMLGEDSIYKGSALGRVQAGNTFVDLGVTGDGFAANAKSSDNIGGSYYGKDFGSEMKYTAQVGRVLDVAGHDVALRAGLKNSSAGLGVDAYGRLPVADKLVKLSADVYDFAGNDTPRGDSPHVDLVARTDLVGERIYGVVGYDNLLSKEYGAPMVGVGVKFQTSAPNTGGGNKYVARKDL